MCKNFRLLSFAMVIAFISLTAITSADTNVCGDVNCDVTCNVADAVWIINYVFAGGYNPCDTDGDGNPDCYADCPPIVTDYDGNTYFVVKIGDQCWMAQNLKVTHYRNGDPIPNVTDSAEWENLTTGAYCEYANDPANVATYGRLYNWYAVDDIRNIAPEGWHVPTDAEWQTLVDYLGGSSVAGGKLKEAGTTHWNPPNTGATNESGFTALPGGYRYGNGYFHHMGYYAFFWSSTELDSNYAWLRILGYDGSQVGRNYGYKHSGFSFRCVRD